jgi:Protein of unknown function (Hypoth_ymh).
LCQKPRARELREQKTRPSRPTVAAFLQTWWALISCGRRSPAAEQEAMAYLFVGAIGLYKNPQSHRYVPTSPEEAAEVILFASHLLRILDRGTPSRS